MEGTKEVWWVIHQKHTAVGADKSRFVYNQQLGMTVTKYTDNERRKSDARFSGSLPCLFWVSSLAIIVCNFEFYTSHVGAAPVTDSHMTVTGLLQVPKPLRRCLSVTYCTWFDLESTGNDNRCTSRSIFPCLILVASVSTTIRLTHGSYRYMATDITDITRLLFFFISHCIFSRLANPNILVHYTRKIILQILAHHPRRQYLLHSFPASPRRSWVPCRKLSIVIVFWL